MAIVRGFKHVPQFRLRHPPFCEEDCSRSLAFAAGREYIDHNHGILWKSVRPGVPWLMKRHLKQVGLDSSCSRVPYNYRIPALQEVLRGGQSAALWVQAHAPLPVADHIITVGAYDTERSRYWAMDDRVGEFAYDPAFPIGNVELSEEQLLRMWQDLPWRSSVVMLTLWPD